MAAVRARPLCTHAMPTNLLACFAACMHALAHVTTNLASLSRACARAHLPGEQMTPIKPAPADAIASHRLTQRSLNKGTRVLLWCTHAGSIV